MTNKPSSRLGQLTQLIAETGPLSLAAFSQCHEDPDEFDSTFVALYAQQHAITEYIRQDWDLSASELRLLSAPVSKAISHFHQQGLQNSYINKLIKASVIKLKEIMANQEVNELLLDTGNNEKLDLFLHVKLSLLTPLVTLSQTLAHLDATGQENLFSDHMINTCIKLATDVSMNWGPGSDIQNPEKLFIEVLPLCGQIYHFAWVRTLHDSLDTLPALSNETFWDFFFDLNNAINENDMGYAGDPDEMSALKEKIKQFVLEVYQVSEHPFLPRSLAKKLNAHYAKQIENTAIVIWQNECEQIVETVSQMTEEQAVEWQSSEEAMKPMDTTHFFALLSLEVQRIKAVGNLSETIPLRVVEDMSRKLMAQFWGATDALDRLARTHAPSRTS